MQRQGCRTEDLKAVLERRTGRRIESLVRLGGGGRAINFKAVQSEDGLAFVVKCYPPDQLAAYDRLKAGLAVMVDARVPKVLFADGDPLEMAGWRILCLSWCAGSPDPYFRFAEERGRAFLDAYDELSERMQAVAGVGPVWPLRGWRDEIRVKIRGIGRWLLLPVLEAMPAGDLERDPERVRTIHGDFHFGNSLFSDGHLECFLDFEDLRRGYPTEDVTCFCLSAAKKTRWYERGRMARIQAFFALAVRKLPYSAREWRTAVNALYLSNLRRKVAVSPYLGLVECARLLRRARLDDRFRAIASEVGGCQ